MDLQHLELFNHLYPVPKLENGQLPTSHVLMAPFAAIHDGNLQESGGEEHYEMPVESTLAWLVANKDDTAAIDPVCVMLHKRRVFVNALALRGESFDKYKARVLAHVVDTSRRTVQQTTPRSARPAAGDEAAWEAFGAKLGLPRHKPSARPEDILTVDKQYGHGRLKSDGPDGRFFIPFDISWAGKVFGRHYKGMMEPRAAGDEPVGGLLSVTAVQKFDEYIEQVVGLKTNHRFIEKHPAFCFNCNKTGQPQAALPMPEDAVFEEGKTPKAEAT